MAANQLPDTTEFRQCFFNLFHEDNGDQLNQDMNAMYRSFNQTMYYLRALRRLDHVIEATSDYMLSEDCRTAIMKMTHCAGCAGQPSSPCDTLCLNVIRGCLVDLSDMFGPFEEFSGALIELHRSISQADGLHYLWAQMNFLHTYFFRTVSDTLRDAVSIEEKVRRGVHY